MNDQVQAQILAIYGPNASYKNKVRVIKQFGGVIISADNVTKAITFKFSDGSFLIIYNV